MVINISVPELLYSSGQLCLLPFGSLKRVVSALAAPNTLLSQEAGKSQNQADKLIF